MTASQHLICMSKAKLCSEKSPSPSSSGVQEQWPTTIHYLKIVEHSWSFLSTESISRSLLGFPDPTDIRKGENKIIFIYKIRNQKMEVDNKNEGRTWRSYINSHNLIKSMWYKVWPERAQGMEEPNFEEMHYSVQYELTQRVGIEFHLFPVLLWDFLDHLIHQRV